MDLISRELSMHLPNVQMFNIFDETLFFETIQNGLTPRLLSRMVQHFTWAEQMKADVVLSTSTVLEPAIPLCQKFVSVPILRINEPMCEQALSEGQRVCVLGSLEKAIKSVAALLREVAGRQGHTLQLTTKCVPQAVERLDMGDQDGHDRLMVMAASEEEEKCDALLLAQLSLSPLLPTLKREIDVPVFGSAEGIVTKLAAMARLRHPTPPPEKTTRIPIQGKPATAGPSTPEMGANA